MLRLVKMATNLPVLPDVERLSPRVIRILGANPGKFTLQGTNTYLIGHGNARMLLDTGEGNPSYKSRLQSVLHSEKCTIAKIILTHWHGDHVQGVPHVLELCPSATVHKLNPDFLGQGRGKWQSIENGDAIAIESGEGTSTLRAIFAPGHTADHTCYLLEEESALFTADAVLGHGTAVFDDLSAYMETLHSLANLDFSGPGYPGHGAVIEKPKMKIREYISHRRQREKQVLDAFHTDRDRKWGSMDIVKVVYKDYPESLHVPAEGGVKLVLEKLELDGKVAEDDQGGWRLKETSSL